MTTTHHTKVNVLIANRCSGFTKASLEELEEELARWKKRIRLYLDYPPFSSRIVANYEARIRALEEAIRYYPDHYGGEK